MDKTPELPTTNSSQAVSPLSESSKQREGRASSIFALLGRLALHYYRPDFSEGQAKLVIEDMIEDLLEYDPREIAEACTAWRRKPEATYFPKPGQLIGCIQERREHSIATARANRPSYRAPKQIEGPRPVLKPWRQILAEKGRQIPQTEREEAPTVPAEQECVDATGALPAERRAELRALREKLVARQ